MKNIRTNLKKTWRALNGRGHELLEKPEKLAFLATLMAYALGAVVCAFMTVVNVFTGKHLLTIVTLFFTFLCFLDLVLCMPKIRLAALARRLFQVEMLLLGGFFVVSGTPEGFSIVWILLTPTAGMFIFGRKETTVMCIINLAMLVFFFQTEVGAQFLQFEYSESFRLRFPIAFIAFFLISFFLESIRLYMAKELEKKNELLYRTFGRFLPEEVVADLLNTNDGFELFEKRAEITVLQSDIRGFSSMTGWMEATELVDMLNHYLGVMTEIIQQYHGTVIEFEGDGILAIFGAPNESSNHATEAVSAAVKMQIEMGEIMRWNRYRGYPEIEIGIGVHSGMAIVGTIGSEKHLKYDAIGEVINIGSRIESCTVGGQTLVSQETVDRINEELRIIKTITITPKGMSKPINIHNVAGIGKLVDLKHATNEFYMRPVGSPVEVNFVKILGKLCDVENQKAIVVEEGYKGIRLQSAYELELYDNIRIDIGNKNILGKIVEADLSEGFYTVRYTSIPPDFHGFTNGR